MKPKSEYHYLKERYKPKLQGLGKYLSKEDYNENTIRQYLNYTAYFLEWMKENNQTEKQIKYPELLSYINHCKDNNDSTRLINRKLASIRKYYEHLELEGKANKNPASGLFLKGKKNGIPNNLLSKEELQQTYESYISYDLRTARNKAILSLIINQALTSGELQRLEPGNLKLKSGKIEIIGTKSSNGRALELEASQIIELQEYLQITRPEILKALKTPNWAGRKADKPNFTVLEKHLFISLNGAIRLKNSLLHLTAALKKINPKIRDLRQLRQSVITEWLKTEDVRNVQYKAGHKHVSTTERYQTNNLEDLQEALNDPSPIRNQISQHTPQVKKTQPFSYLQSSPRSFIYFPYADPSVIFSVMLFVRPTCGTLLFYF
jgi:integrase/recombinase XerD